MRFLSGQHRRSYGNPVKTAKTTEREPTPCGLGSLLVVLQPCHERQYRCVDGKRQQAEARYAFHDPHSIPSLQSSGGCAMIQTTALWWLFLQTPYLALVGWGKGLFFCCKYIIVYLRKYVYLHTQHICAIIFVNILYLRKYKLVI